MSDYSLKSGQIVTATAEFLPFIHHCGIVISNGIDTVIYHNSPTRINKMGGSVVFDNINDWFARRTFVSVEDTNFNSSLILSEIKKVEHLKFNLASFNCEHFITGIVYQAPTSYQLKMWTLGIVTYFATRRSKK